MAKGGQWVVEGCGRTNPNCLAQNQQWYLAGGTRRGPRMMTTGWETTGSLPLEVLTTHLMAAKAPTSNGCMPRAWNFLVGVQTMKAWGVEGVMRVAIRGFKSHAWFMYWSSSLSWACCIVISVALPLREWNPNCPQRLVSGGSAGGTPTQLSQEKASAGPLP